MANDTKVLGKMFGAVKAPPQQNLDIGGLDPLTQFKLGRQGRTSTNLEAKGPKLRERNLIASEREIARHDVPSDFYFTDNNGNTISRTTLEDQGIDTSDIKWDVQKSPKYLRTNNQIAITMNGKVVNVDDSTRQPIHNKSGQVAGYYSNYIKPETYYSDERKEEIVQSNYIRDMESLGYGRKQIENALAHMKLVGVYDSEVNQYGSKTWAEYTKNLKIRKYNHDELVSLVESGFMSQPTIAGARKHVENMRLADQLKDRISNWTPAKFAGTDIKTSQAATTFPQDATTDSANAQAYSYNLMRDNTIQPVIKEGILDGVDEDKELHINNMFYLSGNTGIQDKNISQYATDLANNARILHDTSGFEIFQSGIMTVDRAGDTVRGTPQSLGQILYEYNETSINDTAVYDTATADDIIRFLAKTELIAYNDADFNALSESQKVGYKLTATAYYHSVIKPELVETHDAYKAMYGSNYTSVIKHYWDGMTVFAQRRATAKSKLNSIQSNIYNSPSGQALIDKAADIEIFTDKFLNDTNGQVSLTHVITSLAGKTYQEKVLQLHSWQDQGWLTPQGVDFGYRIVNYQEEQTAELRNQIDDWESLLEIQGPSVRRSDEGYKPGLNWLPFIGNFEHRGTLVQGMEFNSNTNEWSDRVSSIQGEDRRLQVILLDLLSQEYTKNKIRFIRPSGEVTVNEARYIKQILKKDPEAIKEAYSNVLDNWTDMDIKVTKDMLLTMEDAAIEDNIYRLKQVKTSPFVSKEPLDAKKIRQKSSGKYTPFDYLFLKPWKEGLRDKGKENLMRYGSPLIQGEQD